MKQLTLNKHGIPENVCHLNNETRPQVNTGQAIVEMLFSPIDPADINICEGKYPIDLPLPAVPGIEGIGCVVEADDPDARIQTGQLVLSPGQIGHWCNERLLPCRSLYPVSDRLDPRQASMLISSMATPWLMLNTFTTLKTGEWFIQNAANSAVGRSAIQLGRHQGLKSVNIVRRPELIDELKNCGANHVFTEDEFDPRSLKELCDQRPGLGLNGVGGESAGQIAKALGNGGTLVTYGGMSMKPLTVGTGQLIFKDLRFRGFWITQWYRQASSDEIANVFTKLSDIAQESNLSIPVEAEYPLTEYREALMHAQQLGRSGKILFNCQA